MASIFERAGLTGRVGRAERERSGVPRRRPARRRGGPSLLPLNWGMLVLFLLFTSVVGVRRVEAQIDWRAVGSCAGACSAIFANISSSLVCSGCLVAAGVIISDVVFGDVEPYGWGCAKANIGC